MFSQEFLPFLYAIEIGIPNYSPEFENISDKLKQSGYTFSYLLSSSAEGRHYIAYTKPIRPDIHGFTSSHFEIIIDVDRDSDFGRIAARYIYENGIRIISFCEYDFSGLIAVRTFVETIIHEDGRKATYEQTYHYNNKNNVITFNATYPYKTKPTLKIRHALSYNGVIEEIKGVLYGLDGNRSYISIDHDTLLSITGIELSSYTLQVLVDDFDNLITDRHYDVLSMLYI